ncbi:MAG: hypothetical protein FWF62_01095 [Candidatus Bathyarchaeota archaeon]|nr:hypothetical protein [Candidatus Termiticorpusculum sp.]
MDKRGTKQFVLSTVLCIALLSLMFVGFVQAQAITLGVKPGMAFEYTLTSYWSSSESNYNTVPQDLLMINHTSYVEVRVSTVNNTHVTTANPWYFKDGTSYLERGEVNLFTGEGHDFVAIIGANLKVGDLIHPNGNDGLKVLDTTNRSYGSSSRETNHIRITSEDKTAGYKGTRDVYFDKVTGILVEQKDTTEYTTFPASTSQITWKLTAVTGVDDWTITESNRTLQIILLVAIVAIIAVISVIVYKKKLATPKIAE